jgi:hypothetical protein
MSTSKGCSNCAHADASFSCGGCYQYKYCGKRCQTEHWHKWGHDIGCRRFRTGKTVIEGPYWKRFYWELTDEEIEIEKHFDKMAEGSYNEYKKRKFHGPGFSSHKWLLDEWNKNSKLLLNAADKDDELQCKELLIHRLAVHYRLDDYEMD